MNDYQIAEHKIGPWMVVIEELVSDSGSLYERTFSIYKHDSAGKIIVEFFPCLIEAIEFAQHNSGQPEAPYAILENMAAQAKQFYYRKTSQPVSQ